MTCRVCARKITGRRDKKYCSGKCRWEVDKHRTDVRAKRDAYYKANREKIKATSARWHRANRKRRLAISRKWELKQLGLTPGDYARLCRKQRGRCAICSKKERRLCVDHCHTSSKVRGLLCGNCNRALGLFRDNTRRLCKAIAYLERNPPR